MFKRFSNRYVLIAGVAALALFALPGCHNSPASQFDNMTREQQLKTMQPSAATLAAGNRAGAAAQAAAGANQNAAQMKAHMPGAAGATK